MAIRAVDGLTSAVGGVIPRIRSRITPPPIDVVIPSTQAPKMSISFFMAVSDPERANDIVPRNSSSQNTKFIALRLTFLCYAKQCDYSTDFSFCQGG